MLKEIRNLIINYTWEKCNDRVVEIEKLKDSYPKLWTDFNFLKRQYINCMNAITSGKDDKLPKYIEEIDNTESIIKEAMEFENKLTNLRANSKAAEFVNIINKGKGENNGK